jgi:hypothetical protein
MDFATGSVWKEMSQAFETGMAMLFLPLFPGENRV